MNPITNFKFTKKIDGGIKQLSTHNNNTCGVNHENVIFCIINNDPNAKWRSVNGRIKHISTYNGKLYGTSDSDEIFYANDLNNVVWQTIPGRLKQVSMYENKVCGVSSSDDVFCRNNLTDTDWFSLPGKLKQVSFYKGILAGVNSNNDMYYTTDINKPNSWINMSAEGKFIQVDVNDNGFCGITPDNNLICKNDETIGGPMVKKIGTADNNWKYVDSKNGAYGITNDNNIYFTKY